MGCWGSELTIVALSYSGVGKLSNANIDLSLSVVRKLSILCFCQNPKLSLTARVDKLLGSWETVDRDSRTFGGGWGNLGSLEDRLACA